LKTGGGTLGGTHAGKTGLVAQKISAEAASSSSFYTRHRLELAFCKS